MTELTITNLTKEFGSKHALDNVNVTFHSGHIYGLLGRNGAGKSTLLNLINQRIFTQTGTVSIDNTPILENNEMLSQCYLVSEDDFFPKDLKVKNSFKNTKDFYGDFNFERANQLVQDFGIDPNQKFGKLSTGYRTIAKIINALCCPATFIFLDEPVLGLDANHRDLFYRKLLEAYQEDQQTYIISTHLIEEISGLIEKIVIVKNGKVIESSDTETLVAKSHAVSGPIETVNAYLTNSHIIGSRIFANQISVYLLGDLPNDPIPDGVKIQALPLQELFIHLTDERKN